MHLVVWVCFGWDLKNWDPVYSVWVLKISLLCYMLFASCLIPSTLWDHYISAMLCVHSCKMFWGPPKWKVLHKKICCTHLLCLSLQRCIPFVIVVSCIHDYYCINQIVSKISNLFNILSWHDLSFIQTSTMIWKKFSCELLASLQKVQRWLWGSVPCWEPWFTPVIDGSWKRSGPRGIKSVQHQASIQFIWKFRNLPLSVAFVTPCSLESLKVARNIIYNNLIGVS